jgi:hypothetical protein
VPFAKGEVASPVSHPVGEVVSVEVLGRGGINLQRGQAREVRLPVRSFHYRRQGCL